MTALAPRRTAQLLRLSDGRQLGYADYGDPDGTPVMFFHGTPGSRRSVLAIRSSPKN